MGELNGWFGIVSGALGWFVHGNRLGKPKVRARYQWIRKTFARLGFDPLVRYEVGRKRLLIPFSHNLPLIHALYPEYSANLERLARYLVRELGPISAVDVGANVGDSIGLLQAEAAIPVLAVEPFPRYLDVLRRNYGRDSSVVIAPNVLGMDDSVIHGKLTEAAGTAAIQRSSSTLAATTLATLIASQPGFEDARLLKIDTDGYDGEIIAGAIPWLRTARPVVFFEFDPDLGAGSRVSPEDALDLLRDLGYRVALIYANTGEVLRSADLALDRDVFVALGRQLRGFRGKRYADIAIFSADDDRLAHGFVEGELDRGLLNGWPGKPPPPA